MERVFMRWPDGLKQEVEARVGPGLITKFTVAAVRQALSAQGWYIDQELCKKCGVAKVAGECWTCD